MRGEYRTKSGLIIPNNVLDEGELAFLSMIVQADVGDVSAGGDWFFGLMEDNAADTLTLSDIVDEPTSAGGYARQPITRDTTGWPTIGNVNNVGFAETADITFAASGADFSTDVSRIFLTNVVSGTGGLLFSISSPFAAPLLILDGQSPVFNYRLYMR